MKSRWKGMLLVILAAIVVSARAQEVYRVQAPSSEFNYKVAAEGQNTFYFEANMESPMVTGAPYTAQAVTTMTQTLADGNKIKHTSNVSLARDSEGRTRREQSLANLGPWDTNSKGSIIVINDPVAHARYELQKLGDKTIGSKTMPVERMRILENKAKERAEQQVHEGRGTGVGVGVGVGTEPGVGSNVVVVTSGGENVVRRRIEGNPEENKNVVVEDLGTQTIEGVSAKGTRKTVTIPAGQVGNDLPINIVSESWYSADLKMTVMSKRNDPRVGETEFKLTNIQRGEPDASLFQPPPGVELREPLRIKEREF